MFLITVVGCEEKPGTDRAEKKHPSLQIKPSYTVAISLAVLGGDNSEQFRNGLHSAGVTRAATTRKRDVTSRAALIASSDAVIILVDATQGPLPINREDILLCRQFSSGPVMIGFSQSSLIDDAELLELEELEMRELLNTYDLPGDHATVFFDSSNAPTRLPKGYDAIAGILSKIPAGSGPGEKLATTNSFEASIYALAGLEAYERGISKTIKTGNYRIVFGHIAIDAELVVTSPIQPGKSGTARVNLHDNVGTLDATRFVIGSPDHVIAAGTIRKR